MLTTSAAWPRRARGSSARSRSPKEFGEQEILSLAHGFFGYFALLLRRSRGRAPHLPEACESPNAWEARFSEASPIAVSAAFI